ncbi:coenzyme F390 synthetase [Candidatus Methanoperedens nitroreducens]|uniref:Coenzyme F390 synthetase n=1 Tax=Candidatus Methanoperedens nitratireducens TaxID=1392998 RepID=A0A062V120_9EURY|nr:phenylacetate--CoA ligase family protein [Candidatus Methanoperedens nitroreducens]KCZ72831.1 coenzyme F390 synthetase [Candidatus Methanoperedens nitroreducens]MDJ1423238.1 phenylacetate--CoA ligase family protein [Candidatus Methanoperedens sp.]
MSTGGGVYSKIFRNLLFPVMELCYGTNTQQYLSLLCKTQWWSREGLEELQNKKLRVLINHAYTNVPYYHKMFKERNIRPEDIKNKDDLEKLPILTKDIIRKNLPELVARNINKSRIIEFHSSGSTGEPMRYYLDKGAYSSGWAQTYRCWTWAGYNIGDPYVKISLNSRTAASKKIQDRLLNTCYVYASGITENNLGQELSRIKKCSPKIIRGYASYLYTISKLMENLYIYYTGANIATTGDMLFPHYREAIERQFNCKIFDGYGGEGTPISFQCENHNEYHICDEDAVVEFIREGERVAPDEIGKIVFTNLNNYAMPFIRYDINDLGKSSEELCNCGRGLSLMKSIEGRDTDIIITPAGGFIVVQFFTVLFKSIEGVDQFQIIQERIDRIIVKIIKNDRFTADDLHNIKNKIQSKVGGDVEVNIEFVDEIPLSGRSGKRKFIISRVPLRI